MKNLYGIKVGIFYSLYLALVICVLSPLHIISSNPNDFAIDDVSFFWNLIDVSIVFFIFILFPISFAFIFTRKNTWFKLFLFSIIVMVSIFALYLPLSYGILDGVDTLKISYINLTLGVLFSILSYFLFSYKKIILLILIIGPLVTSTFSVLNIFQLTTKVLPVSKTEKNIFVISFDSLQTEYIKTVIDSLPEQKKAEFDGFVLFDEVMGVVPYTIDSLNITKLGRIVKDHEYEKAFHNQITTKLSEKGYNVETTEPYFSYYETSNTNKIFPSLGQGDPFYFLSLKGAILRILPYENNYVNLLKGYVKKREKKILQQIELDKNIHAYLKPEVLMFDEFTNRLKIGSTKPTLRMHHYMFTHNPVRLNADCIYAGLKYAGSNETASILSETKCAINKMTQLIQKIKELGIYQNSIIFFVSDHGYTCGYERKLGMYHPNNYRVSRRWCLTRYTPFMMVKPPLQNGPLKESKIPVSLFDIAKTICMAALNDQKECNIYQGYDLFSSTPPSNAQFRPMFIQKTAENKKDYQGFEKLKIPRYKKIKEYGFINKKIPQKLVCSQILQFNKGSSIDYYLSNFSSQEKWGRWSDGGQARVEFQIEPNCKAKSITFNLKAFVTPKNPEQTATVYINNKRAEDIRISLEEAQPKQFTFALPDAQNNKYSIRFEIYKPTTPKSVGVHNDTRALGFGFIGMKLLPDELAAQ